MRLHQVPLGGPRAAKIGHALTKKREKRGKMTLEAEALARLLSFTLTKRH